MERVLFRVVRGAKLWNGLPRVVVVSHQQGVWSCGAAAAAPTQIVARRWLSSAEDARRVPPNLWIDPRSSFAPVRHPSTEDEKHEEDEEEDGHVKEASSAVEDAESSDNEQAEYEEDEDYDEDDEDDYDEDEEEALFIPPEEVVYAVPLPDRLHVPVYSLFAPQHESQVGTIWLNEDVFGREPVRVDLIKRAVNYVRAKKRGKRTAKTKTISEVSGSGRKLRPQKGQGRARVGHSRPPHFRGGAKAHGPKNVTDYGKTKLNKKVRKLAMCHLLSQKLLEGNLIVLNQLYDIPSIKTNPLAKHLTAFGDIGGKNGISAMIADSYFESEQENEQGIIHSHRGTPVNFWVASSNIPKITIGSDRYLNAYRILRHEKLILTLAAVEALEQRLKTI